LALVETCSMPSHARRLALGAAALLIPMAAMTAAPAAAAGPASPVVASAAPSPTPPVTDNPFLPPDKNLTDCVSANPQPGCGSKAHGGWRQTLTFVIVALAMAFIGWRIVVIVRRNRKAVEAAPDEEPEPSGRR
jgi:hypothetical protein